MTTFASGVFHDDSVFTAAWIRMPDTVVKDLIENQTAVKSTTSEGPDVHKPSTSSSYTGISGLSGNIMDNIINKSDDVEDVGTPTSENPKTVIASCSVDGKLVFSYSPSLGSMIALKKLTVSSIGVFRLSPSPSRKFLAIMTIDHSLVIFNVETMKVQQKTAMSALSAWTFSWIDDQNLIACGRDLSIHHISLSNQRMNPIPCPGIFSSSPKARFIISSAVSPEKDILAVGTGSGHMILFDLKKMKQTHLWKPHTSSIRALCWDNFNHIISGSDDGTICVWSMTGNLVQQVPNSPHKGASIMALTISPKKSTQIQTGTQLENISGSVISTRKDDPLSDFNPTKTVIATGCSKGRVAIWELGSKDPLATFSQHNASSISSLDFDPTGRYLVSSGLDGQIVIYTF